MHLAVGPRSEVSRLNADTSDSQASSGGAKTVGAVSAGKGHLHKRGRHSGEFFDLRGQFIHKNSVRRNTAFLLAFLQLDLSERPPSTKSRWTPRGSTTLHEAAENMQPGRNP